MLTRLKNSSLHTFKSEHDLLKAISELSDIFNIKRHLLKDYVKDERLVSAYAILYGMTNKIKIGEVLGRLPEAFSEEISKMNFIDFGCGPATYSLGLMDHFEEKFGGNIIAYDKSPVMIEQGRKIFKEFYPAQDFLATHKYNDLKNIKGDTCLFFGNSANEIGRDHVMKVIRELKPKVVFFIEPGTKQSFSIMKDIRHDLKSSFSILYPCTGQGECPVKGSDWCHQYVKVTHDHEIERLCQLAHLDRRSMPLIAHVYHNKSVQENKSPVIFRKYEKQKFAQTFEVCLPNNTIQIVEVLFKGLDKSTKRELQRKQVGETISYTVVKELENDIIRVLYTS
jgi:hypothetical protein